MKITVDHEVCFSVCLFVCMFVCFFVSLIVCLSVYARCYYVLSVVHVCLLFVCLNVFTPGLIMISLALVH